MPGVALLMLMGLAQFGQTNTGELHLSVADQSGLGVAAVVELANDAQQFKATFNTNAEGHLIIRRLAFGTYRVTLSAPGFAPSVTSVAVKSVTATEFRVMLSVAPVQTTVAVSPSETLVDPSQTSTANYLGATTLQQRITALPGRALPDLVNTQPGWLLEANGILHPRGSEYQTQYVVDGLPLTDNRSPAFAPELDADDVHAMKVLTSGYPAEYGRKLGGVIEVVTAGAVPHGFHASVGAFVGSFASASGTARVGYATERFAITSTGSLSRTDRYLDPPVEENFSNRGTTSNVSVRVEGDLTARDRLGAIVRHGQASFLVPNERVQEEAGQRQDRSSDETMGQVSYQRVLSQAAVLDVRGFGRTVSAALWSNQFATPIDVSQDRGFRELYLKAAAAGHRGIHEWKVGGDVIFGRVREQFAYRLTDAGAFDESIAAAFAFADTRPDREQALFVQDEIRAGAWTINAGLRWDGYRLVESDNALSPRIGVAWARPSIDLVVRGSYDRVFQTPAFENLLLASSPDLDVVSDTVLRLPVRPSRGNFFEAGLTKGLLGAARFDVTQFYREADNAADDDVLLNTGVSFPIAFRRSDIVGTEVKLEVPRWRALGASVVYGYMRGFAELPITGGLFLDPGAEELLESNERFPISQDQRHTVRAHANYRIGTRGWLGVGVQYNSGLPVEFSGDIDEAIEQYGARIVEQIDFENERVRPWWALDFSVGAVLRRGGTELRLHADVRNVTNRLNVINFAGLFSGTALAPPRSVALRVQASF
jgi:TonB dependent receptor-like, beta-barrel/Carboxypeptidase regulatory-like domain